ncbi:hypothetical protein ACOMHN_034997 [Nucella lapillus]
MKQLSCLRSAKQWVPEHEAELGTEVKAGDLYLVSGPEAPPSSPGKRRASRYPVHVMVYRSSFGHYAVLTAGLRSPATYLNLRTANCRPSTPSPIPHSPSPSSSSHSSSFSPAPPLSPSSGVSSSSFRVELGGGEGQVIYFEVNSKELGSVGEWVEAFQGAGVPSPGSISPSLSPVIPRSPIMPTLQESLEEEEEISGLG